MTKQNTLYWYDLETFGIESKRDRISQFAGVRTDEDLNIIGEPLTLYCQLSEEVLPEPVSCLVTGITPAIANSKGVKEHEFIDRIHQEFIRPGTCVAGYNNIRFDDEFMRYAFYRNFYDPYEREWKNGNSRWDIIDMVRLTHALRPEGINWPKNEEGYTSFRLELLTRENNIAHEAAHDAMSDVFATIALAKLIKEKQPKLYDFVYNNRSKQSLNKLLDVRQMTPVIHVTSRYAARQYCAAVVAPIAMHPINKNAYIVYDLSVDPTDMIKASVNEIRKRLFTPTDQLPQGSERIPLKAVHVNKCPVVVPLSTLDGDSAKRIGIKLDLCYRNLRTLKQAGKALEKIRTVFANPEYDKDDDAEFRLYDGFFTDKDKSVIEKVRASTPEQLHMNSFIFEDGRLTELFIRFKARNFPEILSEEERLQWEEYRHYRLFHDSSPHAMTVAMFREKIATLKAEATDYADRLHLLDQLLQYADDLEEKHTGVPA